jgi:hypothetical protein
MRSTKDLKPETNAPQRKKGNKGVWTPETRWV